jgi:hypothetical protein
MNYDSQKLGVPNIEICGLQIWVHSLQFPHLEEYWDANWLNVTVHCGARSADVWVSGSIIHLSEIQSWHDQAVDLHKSLEGQADLSCMEPELDVSITAGNSGLMNMVVKITPDHLTQKHTFEFDIDQSYLPDLILSCKRTLIEYPIKGIAKKS